MNDENKNITIISDANSYPDSSKTKMTKEQMLRDYKYCMAQKLLKSMLDIGMISLDEFTKITKRNRQTFSPYLAEIMP